MAAERSFVVDHDGQDVVITYCKGKRARATFTISQEAALMMAGQLRRAARQLDGDDIPAGHLPIFWN